MKTKTIKKYHLKSDVKVVVLCIILLVVLYNVLTFMDSIEYKNAVKRCEGESNIITKYTQQGDKYYICK